MDLNGQPVPLDFAGIPAIDGSLSSVATVEGQVDVAVVEHLRVQVPAAARVAWLEAEQGSWEPWLNRQSGFLGRELHWDGDKEEGQLLIHWASREQWLAIPGQELEVVQERFERLAHAALVRLGATAPLEALETPGGNPFPLVYEGELPPQPRGEPAQAASAIKAVTMAAVTPEAVAMEVVAMDAGAAEAPRSVSPRPTASKSTPVQSPATES